MAAAYCYRNGSRSCCGRTVFRPVWWRRTVFDIRLWAYNSRVAGRSGRCTQCRPHLYTVPDGKRFMEYGFENTLNVFKILMLWTFISIGTYQLKPNILFYRMHCTCYIYVKKEQEKKPKSASKWLGKLFLNGRTFLLSDGNNSYASDFLGFSLYISNTIREEDWVLCFKDTTYTKETIPNPLNISRRLSGRYVIYYNNRTHPPFPEDYSEYAVFTLCEIEVYGKLWTIL